MAIYFFFYSSSNNHHSVPNIDSTHTLVVNLGNLSSLRKLDSLKDQDIRTKYNKVMLKLGRFSKTFDVNEKNNRDLADAIPGIDSAVNQHFKHGASIDSILSRTGSVISVQHFISDNVKSVNLHTDAGRILIRGGNVKKVTLVISTNKENVTPDEFNKEYKVESGVDGSVLRVHIKAHNGVASFFGLFGMNKTGMANITVYVPHTINATASSSAGQIAASQLDGTFDFTTSAGEINLDSLSGNLHARTSMGKISTDQVTGHININTSQGALNMNHTSGTITANTSAGSIRAGIDKLDGNVDLSTSMGTIDVEVPENLGCQVHLNGTSVSVNNGVRISGNVSDKNVDGALNGGGKYTINASTSIGKITLSKN